MKISIIGAGHVGGQIADRLAFQRLSQDIVIVDIDEDLAKGKAEDISHAVNIYNLDCKIRGTQDFSLCQNSDIVVITAGSARKPGMTRDDLAKTNKKVIKQITKNIVKYNSDAIIIVVTNPVDIMTYFVYKYSGFDRSKIIGMAGILDSGRLSYIISDKMKDIKNSDIESMVIGPHGKSMICLSEHTKVKGKSISAFFSEKEISSIFKDTADTGSHLVSLYKGNSAFFGPSAAVTIMINMLLKNRDSKLVPCSAVLKGEYGQEDISLGVPVFLNNKGIKKIVEIELSECKKNSLLKAAKKYKEKIKELEIY